MKSPAAGTPDRQGADDALVVEDVSHVFDATPAPFVALDHVDLAIRRGEFVSLVGRSGCGKSSLLNIMAGLLAPTRGRVHLDGTVVDGPSRSVGMMFQAPVLFPWRTVLSNVLLPAEMLGLRKAAYVARARELLSTVGLSQFERSYPWQLSGGMQQRVSLARVLLLDPEILMLDEPFGALDEFTREALNAELLTIWQSSGKTVVFVTHSITEAVYLSDRVVVMSPNPGRIDRVIDIDLPRPRDRDVMASSRYGEVVVDIRGALGLR